MNYSGEGLMNEEERREVEAEVRWLMNGRPEAVLSTVNGDQPYANLIVYMPEEDLTKLYFVTPRKTKKYRYLKQNPKAALLMDNRANEKSDIHHAIVATALGTCREAGADEKSGIESRFLHRFPYLDKFVKSEDSVMMVFEVDLYYLVRKFQQVTELNMRMI